MGIGDLSRKFGKLRMKFPKVISSGSHKRETWVCDCGKEKLIQTSSVVSGKTKSCGRCNEISAEEMRTRKFGKLQMKDPKAILPGSNKKEIWVCDCGRESIICISSIICGRVFSCGRCNEISAEEMKVRKFGKLRMKDPKATLPGSGKKETWICDCGKEKLTQVFCVISGSVTNCGRCNEISAEEMSIRKFGKLRMKFPKVILPNSHEKELFVCDCGKEKQVFINNAVRGRVFSCGSCRDSIQDWYSKNKETLQSLRCPIELGVFPSGGPIPLEIIGKIDNPFKCQCVLCGKIYYPRFGDIKRDNGGLTCGCGSYRISSGQKDVSSFIRSLGFETELEYKVNRLSYDVYTPSHDLLIEYDGKRWHSMRGSKERDLRKEQNAIKFGYKFFRISEDEWVKNRKRVEDQLKELLIISLNEKKGN